MHCDAFESTQDYAEAYLSFTIINGIPVSHMAWREVFSLAEQAIPGSNHEQKHLLDEFSEYMRRIMTMQKKDSNLVYVVALSITNPDNCSILWIDIVQKHNKYFCPLGGNGWPKDPPNYIGFRYYGQLQSVHLNHVCNNLLSHIPHKTGSPYRPPHSHRRNNSILNYQSLPLKVRLP